MIIRLAKSWRRIWKYRHTCALFVPCAGIGPNDPVNVVGGPTTGLCSGSPRCITLGSIVERFSKLIGRGRAPARIILFAHPSETWGGFAANGAAVGAVANLSPPWWKVENHEFCWLVAHVCYGAKILSGNAWRSTFPHWLSYKNDIHALLMTRSDIQLWAGLSKAIIDTAAESHTLKSLEKRVTAIYLDKMADLLDSEDDRNLMHEMHLQNAMESIVTSEIL